MISVIACDDYKVEAFKEALTKNEFMFIVSPGVTKDTASIRVHLERHRREALGMIVQEVEKKTTRRKS